MVDVDSLFFPPLGRHHQTVWAELDGGLDTTTCTTDPRGTSIRSAVPVTVQRFEERLLRALVNEGLSPVGDFSRVLDEEGAGRGLSASEIRRDVGNCSQVVLSRDFDAECPPPAS